MKGPGLRGRLAISISLILLVALGVTYLAVYKGTGSELRDRTENELEREVETLRAGLSGNGTPPEVTDAARALVGNQTLEANSRVILISVPGEEPVTNQPELLNHEKEHEAEHEEEQGGGIISEAPEGFSSVDVDDVGEVRFLTRSVPLDGGTVATIRVGEPFAPVDEALEGLGKTLVAVGIISLLLAAAAGWLLANSATRPMRRMAEVAEGVDGGDLSERMPIGETRNDEVRLLAESFNGMLDRVEGAFEGQRAFVADASHDLRTPLTIIKGQLEVLSRTPDPSRDDIERVTDLVRNAVARMDRLVADLLTLAKAESRHSGKMERVSLESILSSEIESFEDGSDRRFELSAPGGAEVRADREQLARAVSNLVGNAVQHTEPDGRVRISAKESAGQILISVEDDGPGVPAEMRDVVFNRFSRLESSRSSAGSGLGLAIVKAVAESHGGTVRCEASTLGGSRFVISLPLSG
ncbi:MAG: ATP-binding protein [Solirubrobacterales bacterium]